MELPQCAYPVLMRLHESGVKVACEKVVRWEDIDALADYLKHNKEQGRDGWVYTLQHLAQVETAARTGLPFRILDFFTPTAEDESVELATIVQVHGADREIIWLNDFFKQNGRTTLIARSVSLH